MAEDTIFAKILRKEIPAKIIHEDEECIAFHDVNPQAPVHILVIPRKPLEKLDAATHEDATLLGHLLLTAKKIAEEHKLHESGYRLVINNGLEAGQSVFHLHIHLLGGRAMHWPPG